MDNTFKKQVKMTLKAAQKALFKLERELSPSFFQAVNFIKQRKGKIIITGVGKSAFIGMKMASTFNSLGITSVFLNPIDALHGDLGVVGFDDTVIAISNSGETQEILKIVRHLVKHQIPVISITGNSGSSLSKLSKFCINFKVKDEGSPYNLAPMASATASLVIGDLLATGLSLKNGFKKRNFADFHPAGSLGLQLSFVKDLMLTGSKIPKVKENTLINQTLKEITEKKFGVTSVTDKNGKLVGIMTDGDIRRFLMSGKFSYESSASQAMTKNPKTAEENETLQEALSKMERYKITSLFVVDKKQKCIGMIHMHHIVEGKIV
jgi:arabinose-5-phosphate isomerase